MVSPFSESRCVINNDDLDEELTPIYTKAINTVKQFCVTHNRSDLIEYLESGPSVVLVHPKCHREFTDSRKKRKLEQDAQADNIEPSRQLRSAAPFLWKEKCFLCGSEAVIGPCDVRSAATLPLKEKILEIATDRGQDDEWGLEIKGRLESCCDLVAEEAVYHVYCYLRFTNKRSRHSEGIPPGRPKNVLMLGAFEEMCEWLEANCEKELLSMAEVHEQSKKFASGQEIYSVKHLKRKLQNGMVITFSLQRYVVDIM